MFYKLKWLQHGVQKEPAQEIGIRDILLVEFVNAIWISTKTFFLFSPII